MDQVSQLGKIHLKGGQKDLSAVKYCSACELYSHTVILQVT